MTENVRQRALRLLDAGAGLDEYAESGLLNARKKALAVFRDKLLSAQPPKKKIAIGWHTAPIFAVGDIVALQFQTANKPYFDDCRLSEREYRAIDGQYFVLRKVYDHASCVSAIDPTVKDIWPYFELYGRVFDAPPTPKELKNVALAHDRRGNDVFFCEGSMRLFKRRNCVVIGNNLSGVRQAKSRPSEALPLSDWKFGNADTEVINILYPVK